jgi:23S rRNA pseudouridine1911/1915/1917 synthase
LSSAKAASPRSRPTTPEPAIQVVADRPGERLDILIARACDISRARAHALLLGGAVRFLSLPGSPQATAATSGRPKSREGLKPGLKLEGGETFAVVLPPPEPAVPQAEAIPLTIVYEDAHLIVVDKPAGLPVHPGPGHSGHTLVNALLAHCPDLPGVGGVQRPGIVHRLDKDTSGLIVAAKDDRSHNALSAALKAREVHKTYLALVEGRLDPKEALIDAPIGRDPNNRRRMMVSASGREALTAYKVIEEFPGYTLAEGSPITGRTHQIRVHLASLGHPVAGDPIYGHSSPIAPRLFLHAWKLGFRHPITGEEMAFEAPLAADLGAVLDFWATQLQQ